MGRDKRLIEQLYEQMSPRQRVATLVEQLCAGIFDRRGLTKGLQINQLSSFNGYLGMARARERIVGSETILLHTRSRLLETRLSVIEMMGQVGAALDLLRPLVVDVTEPISREEFEALVRGARAEWFPLDQAALFAILERGQHPTDDSERAWEQLLESAKREIRAAGRAKELVVRGRGARYQVQQGALADWVGISVPLMTPAGGRYEVVDDRQRLEEERARHRMIVAILEMLARWTPDPRTREVADQKGPDASRTRQAPSVASTLTSIVSELQMIERSNREVERANAWVARALGLKEVRSPEEIDLASRTEECLSTLRQTLTEIIGPIPEADPDDDEGERLIHLIEYERSVGEELGRLTSDQPPLRRR